MTNLVWTKFIANLPALIVLIPFIAAPINAFIRKKISSWFFVLTTSYISFLLAFIAFMVVVANEQLIYFFGGWQAPIGIEYKLNILSVSFLLLVSFLAFISVLHFRRIAEKEISTKKIPIFYSLFLILVSGYLGIIVTNDIFNIYVFIEISSLATYSLVAMGVSKHSPYSAFQYLILGTISATFFLLGIGFLYMMTGTLNIGDLAVKIIPISDNLIIKTGISLIIISCLMKAAIFPFHSWIIGVYQYTPSSIVSFLAGISSKIPLYVMIRFIFEISHHCNIINNSYLSYLLLIISCCAIIYGSAAALFQHNLKRIFAFSSVAQLGYILLCVALGSKSGLLAAFVFMFNHAIVKSCIFMICNNINYRIGSITIFDIAGIGKKLPWTSAMLVLNMLALIGVPLTSGFISKWSLISAVIESNVYLLIPIIIGTILSCGYVIRVIEAIYLQSAENNIVLLNKKSLSMNLAILILTVMSILLGVSSYFNFSISQKISNLLIG